MDGKRDDDGRVGRGLGNVPFEFVGEVASAGAVAKARDVKSGAAAARHVDGGVLCLCGSEIRDSQLRQVAGAGVVRVMCRGRADRRRCKRRGIVMGPCIVLAQSPHRDRFTSCRYCIEALDNTFEKHRHFTEHSNCIHSRVVMSDCSVHMRKEFANASGVAGAATR
jgi:hypothetical protein